MTYWVITYIYLESSATVWVPQAYFFGHNIRSIIPMIEYDRLIGTNKSYVKFKGDVFNSDGVIIWDYIQTMMTSSNKNIFCVTGPLCGEFPGHRWIPLTKRGALVFSLICVWINGWVNNREAVDLIRHGAHYDVIVMLWRHCNAYIRTCIRTRDQILMAWVLRFTDTPSTSIH